MKIYTARDSVVLSELLVIEGPFPQTLQSINDALDLIAHPYVYKPEHPSRICRFFREEFSAHLTAVELTETQITETISWAPVHRFLLFLKRWRAHYQLDSFMLLDYISRWLWRTVLDASNCTEQSKSSFSRFLSRAIAAYLLAETLNLAVDHPEKRVFFNKKYFI